MNIGQATSRAWVVLAIGAIVVAGCDGVASDPGQRDPVGTLAITSHETGATVTESVVEISGTAPPGARIVQDISFASDQETTADPTGAWSIDVELDEGRNELTFRIDTDRDTAQTLVLVYEPGSDTPDPAPTDSPTPIPAAPTIPGSIGMTPEEFVARWDAAAAAAGSPEMHIGSVAVEEGDVQDVFQHEINAGVFIQGSVNKLDGSVREVSVIIGAQDLGQAAEGFLAMALLIEVSSPDLLPEERGDVLRELRLFEEDVDISTLDGSVRRGNIEYTLLGVEGVGLFFIADGEPEA